MSFVSPEFALLCLLFFPVYWSLARWPAAQTALLLLSSYGLYATWSLPFAGVLLAYSTGIWALGGWVSQRPDVRLRLALALTLCVSFLAFFKYYEFVRSSLAAGLSGLGLSLSWPIMDLVTPVGVSFFTFQAVSYLVMAGRQPASRRSWPEVLLFLSFWPTVFAGPIWRAEAFFAQRDAGSTGRAIDTGLALYWIFLGAAQKLVLATWLADTFVDPVFKYPESQHGLSLAAGMLGYSLQIVLDFGGYTLIVTGLARLLGYVLPLNFRQPYLARNLQDFWTRWHISLSSFIRDYIYIPMGGNQQGFARTQWHVLVGMLISGVWHGPSWTFVIWGALHGLGVVAFNVYKQAQWPQWPTFLAQALTFGFVTVAWVFFRADTGAGAVALLQGLASNPLGFWPEELLPYGALLAFTVLYFYLCSHAQWWESRTVGWMASVPAAEVSFMLAVLCYGVIAWGPSGVPGFIYYRF